MTKKKTWRDWADEYGKEHGFKVGIRDFGSEDEMMTKNQFEKGMSGQTVSYEEDPGLKQSKLRDVAGVIHQRTCFEGGTFDIEKCKSCRAYKDCLYDYEEARDSESQADKEARKDYESECAKDQAEARRYR